MAERNAMMPERQTRQSVAATKMATEHVVVVVGDASARSRPEGASARQSHSAGGYILLSGYELFSKTAHRAKAWNASRTWASRCQEVGSSLTYPGIGVPLPGKRPHETASATPQ